MNIVWWAPVLGVLFVAGAIALNVLAWFGLLRLFAALGLRRSPNLFLGVRQLAGPKSGFLSVIGLLSILGVSFSSCTLTTVLSVMGGFQEDLKHKIVGSNAHVVVDTGGGEAVENLEDVLAKIRSVPGVIGTSPLVLGEALVKSPRTQNLSGVRVRGADVATIDSVTDLQGMLRDGVRVADLEDPLGRRIAARESPPAADERPSTRGRPARPVRGIFVGAQLAQSMNVEPGDEVQLVAPMGDLGPTGPMPKSRPFVVAGIFESGMYEYDSKHVYITIGEAQKFFGVSDVASQVLVRVADLDRAGVVAEKLRAILPADLRVQDWQSINRNLFAALKLEKVVMFVMLSLSVVVAAFSIFSTLTLMVFEKSKQIAVLKALGSTDGAVRRIYRLQGALIGLTGAVTGSVLGLSMCLLLRYVIPFPVPKEIFYIGSLPISMSPLEFLFVGAAAVAVSTLSTVYPSRIASRLNPADGLRYE